MAEEKMVVDMAKMTCGELNKLGTRHLRAMIENFIETLPTHRHAALHQELALLDRDVEKNFIAPEKRVLARVGDSQGLGGPSGLKKLQ
jgi:hypothetical protein